MNEGIEVNKTFSKEKVLLVYVNAEEKERILKSARASSLRVSSFLRNLILKNLEVAQ